MNKDDKEDIKQFLEKLVSGIDDYFSGLEESSEEDEGDAMLVAQDDQPETDLEDTIEREVDFGDRLDVRTLETLDTMMTLVQNNTEENVESTLDPEHCMELEEMKNLIIKKVETSGEKNVKTICSTLVKMNFLPICRRILSYLETFALDDLYTGPSSSNYLNLDNLLKILSLLTTNMNFLRKLVSFRIFPLFRRFLGDLPAKCLQDDGDYNPTIFPLVESALRIVSNTARDWPLAHRTLVRYNVTKILCTFLDCGIEFVVVEALICLSFFCGSEDQVIVQVMKKHMPSFVQYCKMAFNVVDHTYSIPIKMKKNDTATQLSISKNVTYFLIGLHNLAEHDEMKTELLNSTEIVGIIKTFLAGSHGLNRKNTSSKLEYLAVMQLVWKLSFANESAVAKLKGEVVIENFIQETKRELGTSRDDVDHQLILCCDGVNFQLNFQRPRGTTVQRLSILVEDPNDKSEPRKVYQPQVMISYHWDFHKQVRKLANILQKSGFKVWMDETPMGKRILKSTVEGLEFSDAVLICVSDSYKVSSHCRLEAEYALSLKKQLKFIIFQENHCKPDGWLRYLMGSSQYYFCHNSQQLKVEGEILVKDLRQILGDTTMFQLSEDRLEAFLDTDNKNLFLQTEGGWIDGEIVLAWAKYHKLPTAVFQGMDGRCLFHMKKLLKDCPHFLLDRLEHEFSLCLLDILKVVAALDQTGFPRYLNFNIP